MGLTDRLKRAYHTFKEIPPAEDKVIAALTAGLAKLGKSIDNTTPASPWPAHSMELPIGYNSQTQVRSTESITPQTLRALARNCDLMRIAIQMVKNQLRGLEWDITVVQGYDANEWEPRRQKVREFFRRPDSLNDIGFHDWFGAWLEDLLVLDAPSLLVIRDRAHRLVTLSQIDGATRKSVV